MTDEVHNVFQTELVEAIEAAGRAGLDADKAVYLTLAQAFSLFLQTSDCEGELLTVEFLRIAHLAAIGVCNRISTTRH